MHPQKLKDQQPDYAMSNNNNNTIIVTKYKLLTVIITIVDT